MTGAQPLAVYGFGSDPTNDELPPDDLFGPCDPADNPTPLQLLIYGTRPSSDVEEITEDQLPTGDMGAGARLSDLMGDEAAS